MKLLPNLIRSLWFVTLLVLFGLGLATSTPGMAVSAIAYDDQTQPTVSYDAPSLPAVDYDAAPTDVANETRSGRTGNRVLLARFAGFVAAKTTTGAADDAAKWIWGQNKGVAKSIRQMDQRGWNPQQVTEAIKGGQQFPAQNLVNQGNPAIRYVHPQTGQSVVQDTVTKEIIHFGGPGFKY